MTDPSKPLVVMVCTPIYGHLMPIKAIAKELVQRGYNVTFVSASAYQKLFEEACCTYVPFEGDADFTEEALAGPRFSARNAIPFPAQLAWDIENVFFAPIPEQHAAIQRAIKMLQDQYPGKPIVQVGESVCWGALPISCGARGLKPTATLGLGVIPMYLSSIDLAPFGQGILPDASPEGRIRNQAMRKAVNEGLFGNTQKVLEKICTGLGGDVKCQFFDGAFLLNDRFIQMCTPSAEYPRSDAPSTIRLSGGLPKGVRGTNIDPPPFWSEIVKNTEKKIIFISQGTIATTYTDLTIPVMNALAGREDILLVVALGKLDAKLPEGTVIPSNSRVAPYISYDEILRYSEIFITNGGYGAFQHAMGNGVPIICGGDGEDKPEVCARAEWCGLGVNLRTGKPTEEQILKAVDEVLGNEKYRKRARELDAEMGTFDPMGVVARNIDELAAGAHLN